MRASGSIVLVLALVSAAMGQTNMQSDAQELSALNAISRTEIATLRGLAQAVDPAILGFKDAEEVDQVVIGTPIRAYMIGLEPLQAYQAASTTPRSLLSDTQEVTVPLYLGSAARSAITLAREGDTWTAVSFGGANFVKSMSDLREELAARDGQDVASYFEVRVPALNVVFLGIERDQGFFLASLLDDPRFGLVRGEMRPADAVLERLQAAARAHNGLPT